ncbi:MAG: undecaprenyl-phosphate galactose phosphotransferase WbaP [Phycisphaerae bacterium]
MSKNIGIIFLLLADVAAFYLSIFSSYYTRKSLDVILPPFQISLGDLLSRWWIPAIFLAFFLYENLYFKRLPFWDEVKTLLKTITISIIVVISIITLGKMGDSISRTAIVFLWAYALFFFPILRIISKRVLCNMPFWKKNVIIIGAGPMGIEAAIGLEKHKYMGYRVLGFLDDDEDKIRKQISIEGKNLKVFGKIRNYSKFIHLLNITTVVIALPALPQEELIQLTNEIQKFTTNVLFVPDLKGIGILNTELYHLFNEEFFLLKINNNLKIPLSQATKRVFDIVVSFILLPCLLLVIAIISFLIKLTSRGPVFYSQLRVGTNGKSFQIYKFRSMYFDAEERLRKMLLSNENICKEWETNFKLKKDPRITWIGNFLRKTSLDELPQILNVLKGEMSLVGPRPVIQKEIDLYYKNYASFYFMVRPGVTGIWQISGRSDTNYDRRVKLDTWYVLNWSVWLDTIIILKTFKVILKREGAY